MRLFLSCLVDYATFRLAVPDYASRQAFSSTTYTVPADGWVDVRATLAHGGDTSEGQLLLAVNITRNGATYQSVARTGIYSLTRWTQFNAQATVPVRSGDVVRITTSDNGGNAQITGVLFVPIS